VVWFSPLLKLKRFEIRNVLIPSFVSLDNPVFCKGLGLLLAFEPLPKFSSFVYKSAIVQYWYSLGLVILQKKLPGYSVNQPDSFLGYRKQAICSAKA
jgi:hypothetical protein